MIKRRVWCKTSRNSMPANRHCVKSKWVFKIKRNDVFRARLVACGYSQIPGVDFSESYSPVVHDITFRLLILAMMILGLSAKIMDVKTAFLYGKLEEEIYMECPQGLPSKPNEVLILDKCIYGLVQSVRQYHKKAVKILKKIGFEGGEVDPCLYMRRCAKGIVFLALYVDDNLLVGHPVVIEDTIKKMRKKGLVLKVEGDLKDYLSREINFSKDKRESI